MSHLLIGDDETRTRFAAAPSVRVDVGVDRLPSVRLAFPSEQGSRGSLRRYTILSFSDVMEYTWCDFDVPGPRGNRTDLEFGLIEITDSELIAEVDAQMIGGLDSFERRSGGFRPRHFRIAFDDHGVYDIVALAVDVAVAETSESEDYPW